MCLDLGHYFCKEQYFGDMLFSGTTPSPVCLLLQFVDWHPCGGLVCVCVSGAVECSPVVFGSGSMGCVIGSLMREKRRFYSPGLGLCPVC